MTIAPVTYLDSIITQLAERFDNPNIDYEQIVIIGGWLQTAFEVFL